MDSASLEALQHALAATPENGALRAVVVRALRDDIEDVVSRHFRHATGHGASPAEVRAWKHSLLEMAKVLGDDEIPEALDRICYAALRVDPAARLDSAKTIADAIEEYLTGS